MITSLDKIKEKACREIELPGWDDEPLIVKVRTVSIFNLAAKGKIPNALLSTAIQLFEGKGGSKKDENSLKDMAELIDLLCEEALVEPKYEDIKEYLTDEQKIEIFQFTQGGVKALSSFRGK